MRATKPMMKIMGLGGTLDGPNPNQSCVRPSASVASAGKVRMHSKADCDGRSKDAVVNPSSVVQELQIIHAMICSA